MLLAGLASLHNAQWCVMMHDSIGPAWTQATPALMKGNTSTNQRQHQL